MTNYIFILSSLFMTGCLGLALKPSPIYGGLGLIINGFVGCLVILGYGGSYLGLMVFLVYLGGMLVVFGYTTAMATEEYPDTWFSNWVFMWVLFMGIMMELGIYSVLEHYDGVEIVIEYNDMSGWLVYDGEDVGLMGEGGAGVAAMYSCASWLMVVAGWTLFTGIFIIIEITRE